MPSEAKKRCNARYQKKTKAVLVRFNIHELEEYNNLLNYCNSQNQTIQAYIKQLIKKDIINW